MKRRTFITQFTVGVAALGAGAVPGFGQVRRSMSDEAALRLIFPDGRFSREDHTLDDSQTARVQQAIRLRLSSRNQTVFCGDSGGYAMILNEVGKDQPITFVVGITSGFRIGRIALVVFRETRGWEVEDARFCRQFQGKSINDRISIGGDIVGVTGATLSSRAFCRGARKALAICEALYR